MHLYKPAYTVRIPEGAERRKTRAGWVATWTTKKGSRTAQLKSKNAKSGTVEINCWYIEYRDQNGKRHRVKASPNLAAAELQRSELIRKIELAKSGVGSPEHVVASEFNAEECVTKYGEFLATRDRSEQYIEDQSHRIRELLSGAGIAKIGSIEPHPVQQYLSRRRRGEEGRKITRTTSNNYLRAFKGFTSWLVKTKRLTVDPMKSEPIEKTGEKPAHERRVLSQEDFDRLIETTRNSQRSVYSFSGPERALLYLLAARTGLRAKEIFSLRKSSFDLDCAQPALRLGEGDSKNRDQAVLPISARLAEMLRSFLDKLKPSDRLFPARHKVRTPWYEHAVRVLRPDLAAAGIPYRDDAGRYFDFHSLRSQFITDLDRAGVSLVKAQKLARHSTPVLTAKYYTRTEMSELKDAVDKLDPIA